MTAVKTWPGIVIGRSVWSAHLVTITVEVSEDFPGTGIPDESVSVHLPVPGSDRASPRVYTISDLRRVDGRQHIDLDIVLHGRGLGADWARRCERHDRVEVTEPHGSYAAAPGVGWQLLAADLTGLPALARILRGLEVGQQARATVVLADEADRIDLPSPAEVDVSWVVVAPEAVSAALSAAVINVDLPDDDRYVWVAGEARATRAVRRHLRRELGWPQSDLSTLGYWQVDVEQWNARYAQVAGRVRAEANRAYQEAGADQGAFLDALEDIYERAGL